MHSVKPYATDILRFKFEYYSKKTSYKMSMDENPSSGFPVEPVADYFVDLAQ